MMQRARGLFFVFLVGVFGGRGLSQQSTSIQGVVVDTSSSAPISKAAVDLRSAPATGTAGPVLATTHTDRDGRFVLPNITPGQYRITAVHAGHITGAGTTLTIAPGQRAPDVRLAMIAGGVISGRITDKGQPIGLADAVVFRATYTEGQLSLTPVLADRTNDLGEYHIFWLPPGRYYVAGVVWDSASSLPRFVSPDGDNSNSFYTGRYIGRAVFLRATAGGVAANEAHIPIYYPGTPDPRMARVIDIQPGAVLHGIDIDASALPTRHVRGRVVGIRTPSQGQDVNMRQLTSGLRTSGAQGPGAEIDSNGNFDIPNAVPGRYALTATSGNLTSRVLVDVADRDVSNVVVSLTDGIKVSGRVVLDGANDATAKTVTSNLRIVLRTDPLLPNTATYGSGLQPDGSFTVPSSLPLPAGDYRVLVTPILTAATPPDDAAPTVPVDLQSLYVKSIRMGEVDVLNDRVHLERQPQEPLTIVIGTNPGKLAGRVLDNQQQPVPYATIVLVHDNALRYRVNEKTTASDALGRFDLQNVPPGNYKLFAWKSVDRGVWQDPDLMKSFESHGVPIRIDEGKQTSSDVIVIEK